MACRFGPRHSNFRGEKALATFFAPGERLARRLPTRVELGLFVTSRIPHESLTNPSRSPHKRLTLLYHSPHAQASDFGTTNPTFRFPRLGSSLVPNSAALIGSQPRWFVLESFTARCGDRMSHRMSRIARWRHVSESDALKSARPGHCHGNQPRAVVANDGIGSDHVLHGHRFYGSVEHISLVYEFVWAVQCQLCR